MKVVALFSGGKDSVYALFNAINTNHSVVALLTVKSSNKESFIYHLPAVGLTEYSAEAIGLPLIVAETNKKKGSELEVLERALADMKESVGIEGVVSGTVANQNHKEIVDSICKKLGLNHIAPLWGRNKAELLVEMLGVGFKIVIVGVAAKGLGKEFLGKIVDDTVLDKLIELKSKFDVNVAGESGEFETLVVDCPLFKKKIVITESEIEWEGSCGELIAKSAKLVEKSSNSL